MEYDYLLKLIIIGHTGIGKSCISSVLSNKGFDREYNMTIGVDFFSIRKEVDNILWKIHLWDTAGQESFRSITKSYYRETAICFLTFDLTNRLTFNKLDSWKLEVLAQNSDCHFVVLGNKKDMENKRNVSYEEANEWAINNDMHYYEVSAKNNQFKYKGVDIITLILKDFNNKKDKDNNKGVKYNERQSDNLVHTKIIKCCTIS
jgi:Ras-related protein Rab-2A